MGVVRDSVLVNELEVRVCSRDTPLETAGFVELAKTAELGVEEVGTIVSEPDTLRVGVRISK